MWLCQRGMVCIVCKRCTVTYSCIIHSDMFVLCVFLCMCWQVLGSQESLHQDPESGNMAAPAEDREPSSTIDDQAAGDTEVKVLLLPHTCLHFPPDQDLAAGGATPGPSSQDDCRSLSCSTSIKNSSSADHLSHPVSPHHSEMQALMTAHRDVDEDDDEDEGFDERHRCTARLEDKVRGSEEEDGAGSLQMEQTRKSEERRKSKTLMDMLLEDCWWWPPLGCTGEGASHLGVDGQWYREGGRGGVGHGREEGGGCHWSKMSDTLPTVGLGSVIVTVQGVVDNELNAEVRCV